MNGIVIGFPLPAAAAAPAAVPGLTGPATGLWRIRPNGLQMDFATVLSKLERTQRWLDRNRIEIMAFSASTLRGATVCVRDCPRLHQLLKDEMHSTGHKQLAGVRFEQWQARDPSTGVTIVWDEERREGGRP